MGPCGTGVLVPCIGNIEPFFGLSALAFNAIVRKTIIMTKTTKTPFPPIFVANLCIP